MRSVLSSMPCCLCAFGTVLLGCAQDSAFGRADSDSEPGVKHVEFSIDVAIQRNQWGEQVGRCHLQAALRTFEPQDNEMVPFAESEGSQIVLPTIPNTCEHSLLPDAGPPIEPGADGDNWQITGEDVAADFIELHSAEQTITLEQIGLEGDAVRYEWLDCDQDTFPFGQVFDLEMEDDPGLQVAGFLVEDAFAVGPDVAFLDTLNDPHLHEQSVDLHVDWTEIQDWPTVRGEAVDVERILWARNRTVDDPMPFEALACLPARTEMTVGAADWSKLEANENPQERGLLVGLQVDTVAKSPPFDAPWGQTISIRSTVSDGGNVHLIEDF